MINKNVINNIFKDFNKKLWDLGVELDDHGEFKSFLRNKKTGKVIATLIGNEVDEWYIENQYNDLEAWDGEMPDDLF